MMRFTFYSTLSIAALLASKELVNAVQLEKKDEFDTYMSKHHKLAELDAETD